MSHTPMYVGQVSPAWTPTIMLDSGATCNLTGATGFVLLIRDTIGTGGERTGGGAVTIANAASGIISYPWATADTAVPGTYTLQFKWVPAGGGLQFTDPVPWVVKTP